MPATSPVHAADRLPRPAPLGERRLGVGDDDPADAVLPVGQGEPGELPAEPGRRARPGARTAAVAGRRPARRAAQLEVEPLRPRPAGGSRSSRANRRRSTASGSAVGSGKRCSTSIRGERPGAARTRGRARGSATARSAASPRPSSCAASATTSRWRTNRSGSRSSTGGSIGRARPRRSVARRGPERIGLLAAGPGVQPASLLAEPGDQRRSAAARPRRRSGATRTGSVERGRRGPW